LFGTRSLFTMHPNAPKRFSLCIKKKTIPTNYTPHETNVPIRPVLLIFVQPLDNAVFSSSWQTIFWLCGCRPGCLPIWTRALMPKKSCGELSTEVGLIRIRTATFFLQFTIKRPLREAQWYTTRFVPKVLLADCYMTVWQLVLLRLDSRLDRNADY